MYLINEKNDLNNIYENAFKYMKISMNITEQTEQALNEQGIYSSRSTTNILNDYLNSSFEKISSSESSLTLALAMLDKRMGKRKFQSIKRKEQWPDLLKTCYDTRNNIFSKI